jgi:CRISPR/Cas system-associated exonuclease Cas4 (RecB family)
MSIRNIKASVTQTGGTGLLPAYDAFLIRRAQKEVSHRDGKLHPSFLSGCMTNAALTLMLVPLPAATADARALRIFAMGHGIHAILQKDFVEAGFIESDNGKPCIEVPIEIKKINMVGSADGVIAAGAIAGVPRAVLEIKSINSNSFRTLNEPKPEHKIQGGAYAEALGIEHVLFVYYAKDTSDVKVFLYKVSPRDRSEVYRRAGEIQTMVDAWNTSEVFPSPCFDSPSKAPCSWCVWSRVCHSTFDREAYINSLEKPNGSQQVQEAQPPKRGKPPRRSAKP